MDEPVRDLDLLFGPAVSADPARVVICDEHALFRRALLTALEDDDAEVVAEVDGADEAVTACTATAPDVLFVSATLSAPGAVPVVYAVTELMPLTRVAILVGDEVATEESAAAVAAGAWAVLDKVAAVEGAAAPVVQALASGRPRLPGPVWRRLADTADAGVTAGVTEAEVAASAVMASAATSDGVVPEGTDPRVAGRARSLLVRLRRAGSGEVAGRARAAGLLAAPRPTG